LLACFRNVWANIRQLSGDDAYERYLQHYAEHHAQQSPQGQPLTKEAFFREWQDKKWNGIKRCC
jgi:uncharacterized short protein YbdD (DUF466 family)